LTDSSLKMDTN